MTAAMVARAVLFGVFTFSGLARAAFEVEYANAANAGFFDTSIRTPVGGNPGVTLGEQRRLAFEHALAVWGAALNSTVTIRVTAAFEELECDGASAVLGGARPQGAYRGFPGAPQPDLFYVSALADHLAGEDLEPGVPDIVAEFNSGLDESRCSPAPAWYYGLGTGLGEADFVSTALHELAHGLGFTNLVDEQTGAAIPGLSPYEALTFDNSMGRYWDEMTSAERAASAMNAFGVSWTGSSVKLRAADLLAQGTTRLEVTGDIEWSLTLITESALGLPGTPTTDRQRLLSWSPAEACRGGAPLDGAVLMLRASSACNDINRQVSAAQTQGASAVLLRSPSTSSPPVPVVLDQQQVAIRGVTLLASDFDQLWDVVARGADVWASVSSDGEQLAGADPRGRVRLSASRPVVSGSSISHWDPSVRRRRLLESEPQNLLMEPYAEGVLLNEVDDLTVQLLEDMGWAAPACGNGVLEAGESCDDGKENDNELPDACRLDCRLARCGDGVRDGAETCDGPSTAESVCPRHCGREQSIMGPRLAPDLRLDAGASTDSGGAVGDAAAADAAVGDAAINDAAALHGGVRRHRDAGVRDSPLPGRSAGCGCNLLPPAPARFSWFVTVVSALVYRRRRRRVTAT